MELRIPFTNLSLRMDLGKTDGKWLCSEAPMPLIGGKVSAEKALSIDAVLACVNLYARTVASMPLILYRKGPEGKERATDHPLYYLLHNSPNPNMTSYNFRSIMEASLKLHGNAFAWIEFDKDWQAKALWPLHPDSVFPQRSLKTGELFYDAVLYDGSHRVFRAYEMLHIPGLGFDGIAGKSVIRMFAETMGLSLDLKNYGRKFFKNGARPSGVLMHPESLSEEAQKRLERKFDQRYSGVENTGKTILLEEGMKYEQIGVPPEEAQFLESRKYSVTEIARIFGVPPHMIADLEHATFSNIESQDINFAKHSIMPECVNWEQELMRKLIRDDEHDRYEIEFVMDGLVRGDIESRYKDYAIGRQWGFLNANDIRAKENMNSVDGGETIYVPLNMIGSDLAAPYWQARIKAYEMQGKEVKNNAGEK